MSKNKPQISKKINNQNNNGTNNRYEDIFTQNPNAQKNQNQAKDPFDFVLDYDQSFLRDDNSNKHNIDNQFNTRRSRLAITILK